ncbi:hypothetical protein E2C01_100231 [Portunus trituberculatus]|uniref:Uncharacterized protein n=1 Tax=Portunus trituberculatus TaxID=210409 RepID=A0A5B7KD09_PORTR|nr:hypothetical protein [Portunus trituberculatus]
MKEAIEELKKENGMLMASCGKYEESLKSLQVKVQDEAGKVENGISEIKLEELRNVWKREQEEEKVKFSEVVKKTQEKTKDTLIQVIKEKEELVRDTVDKRKCILIFGLKEKKKINK